MYVCTYIILTNQISWPQAVGQAMQNTSSHQKFILGVIDSISAISWVAPVLIELSEKVYLLLIDSTMTPVHHC